MSERDLYEQNIPLIAEMVVISRDITDSEYHNWMHETIQSVPDEVRSFISKILMVVDKYR